METPWAGDACSLVQAFREGARSPLEELEATLAAVDASGLNAVSYLDADRAREAAATADVSLPFGGIPMGVKELDHVAGWPYNHACLAFGDEVSGFDGTMTRRLREAGAVLAFQTTASEFGGVNVTHTLRHGTTHNPWSPDRTPGGSSGGSAAAVAGGLVTLATAGDGGGSIRIPAGFTGLFGLKGTYGRIPMGPEMRYGNLTSVLGCVSRSVRDTARWFDVTNGFDPRDPLSLPRVGGWEQGLGTHLDELRGMRAAVVPDWGNAVVSPAMWDILEVAAKALIADAGLSPVDLDVSLPRMGLAWALSGNLGVADDLGDRWPGCADDLTTMTRRGLEMLEERYDVEARVKIERRRTAVNETMAEVFEQTDLVITASNPDVAFAAEGPLPSVFGSIEATAGNNGRLTFPANLYGCPAISIPSGSVDGLPVGLQVVARHHHEPVLLDLAWLVERERPWPLVAPGSPC
jgi:aspartyl-tRNA(Asn)/glutamyl-tRNA(Gln) amidotransferase subunit A